MATRPIGALLVNLGTPRSPGTADVRRYLREFLSDPKVIDIPALPRWLLLNAVILPTRPRKSAAAYRKVWTPEGSPLLVHSRALQHRVADALGPDYRVELGMRYGDPTLRDALTALRRADVAEIRVLPLFPQYAEAATGSVIARVRALADAGENHAAVRMLGAFYDDPDFLSAWVDVARPELASFRPDHVLFSYHGLPERQLRRTDPSGTLCFSGPSCCDAVGAANRHCYRAQCYATTRSLVAQLGLSAKEHSTSFQSRLGRTPWIRPYTDERLEELASQGFRRLAVLCPTFVADCLETLEEIGIRASEQWIAAGGEALHLVPSLNAHPSWVSNVAEMLRSPREHRNGADRTPS